MFECVSDYYLLCILDLLKTNSRPPLLSLALARNGAGSCPNAEMRKGGPLPFLNRGRPSTCERFHFISNNTGRRGFSSQRELCFEPRQKGFQAMRFWSFTVSASDNRTDVSSHLRFEKSVCGSQSFVKLNNDLWLRWGMSPVFLCDTRTPKRPRLGQEESGTPIWIMCLTNINIRKK